MISALFVDRPRFAAVIAIVMTIAGLLSLLTIPVAQYPDIVPPQVSVSAYYPGASAAVVEATVAQPIEARVVGVNKMLYMRSVSGNDGSYTLTVSFELGTDPDIDAVNVNNRVQTALPKLPQQVMQRGVTVEKKSAAMLGVITFASPKRSHDALFLSNFVTITALDAIKSTPGVGDAQIFGPQDYAMRVWVQTDRLTGLGLAVSDIIEAIQSQNAQAAVGRIGARPVSNDQQLQLNVQTKGRLDHAEGVRRYRGAQQSRRLGAAPRRRRPGGAGCRQPRRRNAPGRRAGGRDRHLPVPGRQRARNPGSGPPDPARAQGPDARRRELGRDLRRDHFRHRHHPRGTKDPARGVRAGGAGGVPVPRQPACDVDPDRRCAGQPGCHLRRAECRRLFGQHGVAAGDGAGHRHRRRRRHRGGGERRTGDGGAPGSQCGGRHQACHAGDYCAGDCHYAGAGQRVCADRFHSWHLRRTVPAIRGDGGSVDVHLGGERADAVARALRHPAQAPCRAAPRPGRDHAAIHRQGARQLWCGGGAAGAHLNGEHSGDRCRRARYRRARSG